MVFWSVSRAPLVDACCSLRAQIQLDVRSTGIMAWKITLLYKIMTMLIINHTFKYMTI